MAWNQENFWPQCHQGNEDSTAWPQFYPIGYRTESRPEI